MSAERKIVQISAAGYGGDCNSDSVLYALCDDASAWLYWRSEWSPLPPIPQPAARERREEGNGDE